VLSSGRAFVYFLACLAAVAAMHALGLVLARARKGLALALAVLFALVPAGFGVLSRHPVLEARLFPWLDYLYFRNLWPASALVALIVVSRYVGSAGSRRALLLTAALVSGIVLCLSLESIFLTRYTLPGSFDADGVALQTYGYTCAAAAMVTFLDHFGISTSEGEMATLAATRVGRGAPDVGILRALRIKTRNSGLKVAIVRASYPELLRLRKPLLVSMGHNVFYDHAVVVLEADARALLLANPAIGRESRMRAAFMETYRGHAFVLYRQSIYESPKTAPAPQGGHSGSLMGKPTRRSSSPPTSRKVTSSRTSRPSGGPLGHLSFTR